MSYENLELVKEFINKMSSKRVPLSIAYSKFNADDARELQIIGEMVQLMPNITSQALRNFYKTTPMREGILHWYPFDSNLTILEQSGGALTKLLQSKCKSVVSFADEYIGADKFDYVVCVDPGKIVFRIRR